MVEYKRIIAQNKKASFNYFIIEKFEAGIVLRGSEVKSIRAGKCNIEDSYASNDGNEIVIFNMHVAEYEKANRFNHQTRAPRKLLLHNREIKKIIGKIRLKGLTLIALSIYFNKKNLVKLELGLAEGKKLHDKRASIKEKEWKREQGRLIRKRDF